MAPYGRVNQTADIGMTHQGCLFAIDADDHPAFAGTGFARIREVNHITNREGEPKIKQHKDTIN